MFQKKEKLTMFDDVKKGEKFGIRQKLNKKPSIKSKTINYEQLKKKQPIKSKTTNYEKLMNELENLKNNIKSTMLSTIQISNF